MEYEFVGQFIRERRDRLGLSMTALAERAGMSVSYLSQVESGVRKWPAKYIPALARALSVSIHEMEEAGGRNLPQPKLRGTPAQTVRNRTQDGSFRPARTRGQLSFTDYGMAQFGNVSGEREQLALRAVLQAYEEMQGSEEAKMLEGIARNGEGRSDVDIMSTVTSLVAAMDMIFPDWERDRQETIVRFIQGMLRLAAPLMTTSKGTSVQEP